jgi:hypothetical protein
VSRDEYFFKGLKIKTGLFDFVLKVFISVGCQIVKKSKIKFLLASMNHLLIVKILSVTLFKELVQAFR